METTTSLAVIAESLKRQVFYQFEKKKQIRQFHPFSKEKCIQNIKKSIRN